jgi:hypothetical protein
MPVEVFVKNNSTCACLSRTFGQEFALQNWGAPYTPNIVFFFLYKRKTRSSNKKKKAVMLLMTEPATPVLYVVKLPVEITSV